MPMRVLPWTFVAKGLVVGRLVFDRSLDCSYGVVRAQEFLTPGDLKLVQTFPFR